MVLSSSFASGGAVGDEGSVCRTDQGKHWRGGKESSHDLGSAQSTGPAAGTSKPMKTYIYLYKNFFLWPTQSFFSPSPQIKGMKDRLDLWCGDVKNMAMLVEQQAQDILT